MPPQFNLYELSGWVLFAVLFGLIGGATAAGLWFAARRAPRPGEEAARSHLGTALGGVLGMLALLLSFTFSIALERFEVRKALIVEEANALGTLWLRLQLLPDSLRLPAQAAVRQYVDADVQFYALRTRGGVEDPRYQALEAQIRQLSAQLWQTGVQAAAADKSAVTALLLQSLNQTIDLHEKRHAAGEYHVPGAVLFVVFVVAVLAAGLLSFACGMGPRHDRVAALLASGLVLLVSMMIVDLDRPRRGFITTGQQSLLRLQAELSRSP